MNEDDEKQTGPFEVSTMAMLTAGRMAEVDVPRGQLDTLALSIEEAGRRHGAELIVLGEGDLTADSGPMPDEQYAFILLIGLVVAGGGSDEPLAVPLELAQKRLAQASRLPPQLWADVEALVRSAGGKLYEEPARLHLVAAGPLACAKLAFGVLGGKDDARAGTFVFGQDTSQVSHKTGVWGVRVAKCEYESGGSTPVDLSDAAHDARAREIPGGRYFLISQYD